MDFKINDVIIRSDSTFAHSAKLGREARLLAAITGSDRQLKVWSSQPGGALEQLCSFGDFSSCRALALSPDGREVAFTSEQNHGVERVILGLGRLRPLMLRSARYLTYSTCGCLIAATNDDGDVRVWDLTDLEAAQPATLWNARIPGECITDIQFGHNGLSLFALTASGRCFQILLEKRLVDGVRLHYTTTKQCLLGGDGKPAANDVFCLAVNRSYPMIAVGGAGSEVYLQEFANNTLYVMQANVGAFINGLHFLNCTTLAVVGQHCVEIWKLTHRTWARREQVGDRTELLGRGTYRPEKPLMVLTPALPGTKAISLGLTEDTLTAVWS
jgi:WD40 repeat protein